MLGQNRPGVVKQRFFEGFRAYLDFLSEIQNSVTYYFALEYVEAVYEVSARLTKLLDARR